MITNRNYLPDEHRPMHVCILFLVATNPYLFKEHDKLGCASIDLVRRSVEV